MRNLLIMTLAIAGLGFVAESKASAQGYTVYIWNTRTNSGWFRSGLSRDVYTSRQACLNSITSRVNENIRFRSDFQAFAVVRTTCRPGSGTLCRQNVPCGWNLQIRYIPGDRNFRTITVWNTPKPRLEPMMPLYIREETAIV